MTEFDTTDIVTNKNGMYGVDVRKLLNVHLQIAMRYEPLTTFEDRDAKSIIKLLDKYHMHLVEEVDEFMSEGNSVAEKMELLDVLGYSATIYHIVDAYLTNMKAEPKILPFVWAYSEHKLVGDVPESKCHFATEVLRQIILGRRQFPERKWHKTYDAATESQLIERLTKHRENLLTLVEYVLRMWNYWYGINTFQDMYERKLFTIKSTFI